MIDLKDEILGLQSVPSPEKQKEFAARTMDFQLERLVKTLHQIQRAIRAMSDEVAIPSDYFSDDGKPLHDANWIDATRKVIKKLSWGIANMHLVFVNRIGAHFDL